MLFEIARNAANEVAADAGHLSPSRIFIGEVKAATGGAGVPAISDAEKNRAAWRKTNAEVHSRSCRERQPVPRSRLL